MLKAVKYFALNIEQRTQISVAGVSLTEHQQGFHFHKSQRLLNSSDFSYVFDNAPIKASHPQFLILAKPSQSESARLGLVIAKKNVRLAVNRNRLKRLIRESFRYKQHHLPAIDAIVLARRGTENLNNLEITNILNDLWQRVAKRAAKLPGQSPSA